MELQNTFATLGGEGEIPSGHFTEVRLIFSGMCIEVDEDGDDIGDASYATPGFGECPFALPFGDLQDPSFMQSGLKIKLPGGNFEIDMAIQGPELQALEKYTRELKRRAGELGGIVDADTTLDLDKPELRVEIDREVDALEIETPPFTRAVGLPRVRAHWVRPEIVVEVAFIEWTVHGKLRHSRLLAIHDNRSPHDVRRH